MTKFNAGGEIRGFFVEQQGHKNVAWEKKKKKTGYKRIRKVSGKEKVGTSVTRIMWLIKSGKNSWVSRYEEWMIKTII